MKKLFILATFFGLAFGSKAQVTFTPEVGYNLNKFVGYTYDPNINERNTRNYDWMGSPRAGVSFDIPLGTKGFSMQPGLFYDVRTTRLTYNSPMVDSKVMLRMNFLQLPINLKYSWEVSRYSGKLFWMLTPYVGYALSGTQRSKSDVKIPKIFTSDTTAAIQFGSELGAQKALDYGTYFGMGYQFQWGMEVKAMYGRSFANFSNLDGEHVSTGGVFNISIGYVLGRRIPGRFY